MASVSGVLSSSFHCSVCLDVFRHFSLKSAIKTVTIPCGHSFCKVCIAPYRSCPVCQSPCDPPERPPDDLCSNNNNNYYNDAMFSRMAAVRRRSPADRQSRPSSVSEGLHRDAVSPAEEEVVPLDIRPPEPTTAVSSKAQKRKRRAQKRFAPGAPPPGGPPKSRTCQSHGEPLNIFCQSDLVVICLECLKTEHKAHAAVLLEEEYQRAHAELRQIRSDVGVMVAERRRVVRHLRDFVHKTNGHAAKDKASAVAVFDALAAAVQCHRDALVEEIEERRRVAQERARRSVDRLEGDIATLQGRIDEIEQSLDAQEHHRLLQTFQVLCGVPEVLALSEEVKKTPAAPRRLGSVLTAVSGLEETLHDEMEAVPRAKLAWARRRFSRHVTLDPDTASPSALVLSEGGRRVRARRDTWPVTWSVPSRPGHRRTDDLFVLARDPVYSSKLYYEVQVKGNTDWKLGAVEKSFKHDRTRQVASWSLQLDKNGNYSSRRTKRPPATAADTTTPLFPSTRPERIGVLVDYTGREVCFYDVGAKALLQCFTQCEFVEPLYPMLWSDCDNAPLVILSPGAVAITRLG